MKGRTMRDRVMVAAVLALGVCALGAASAPQKEKTPAKTRPTAAERKALDNYQTICQPCHGPKGNSPMPTMSLVDRDWKQGTSTAEIAKTIAEGLPGTAMLPNKDKLSKEEILELAKLVRTFDPKLKPEKSK
jgi:mono/diheme cytochrome c family protein